MADVMLIEPARQRLLAIASDVLGRLPADQVPASLRAVARFAPAKRARLGAAALSAALDADEGFRRQVADVVAETSPQLADTVRTGGPTTASDPIDVSVVAYLLRAEGWPLVVMAAQQRYTDERRATERAAVDRDVERLRAELAEAKASLRVEAAAGRAAVAAAHTESVEELADLRRDLRTRTAELQTVRRELDIATAALAEVGARADATEGARDLEARRLRNRVAELERGLETARRASKSGRELDDARLYLLIDTLTEAAAGIRRELSLAAPGVRPADTVASSARADAAARQVDDPRQLDRLLTMPNVHLIVDGYNVTKTAYGELPLADQRRRLVGQLAALEGRTGAEITLVFDGAQRPPAAAATPRGVRVLFSANGQIADDLIRDLLAAEPVGRPVLVASSDQAIAMDVRRAGAWSLAAAVLLARLQA